VKGHRNEIRGVLAALASREESASLRRILCDTDWALRFTPTFPDTRAELRAASFGVVICAGHFGDGHCWKDVLNEIPLVSKTAVTLSDFANSYILGVTSTLQAAVHRLRCLALGRPSCQRSE